MKGAEAGLGKGAGVTSSHGNGNYTAGRNAWKKSRKKVSVHPPYNSREDLPICPECGHRLGRLAGWWGCSKCRVLFREGGKS